LGLCCGAALVLLSFAAGAFVVFVLCARVSGQTRYISISRRAASGRAAGRKLKKKKNKRKNINK